MFGNPVDDGLSTGSQDTVPVFHRGFCQQRYFFHILTSSCSKVPLLSHGRQRKITEPAGRKARFPPPSLRLPGSGVCSAPTVHPRATGEFGMCCACLNCCRQGGVSECSHSPVQLGLPWIESKLLGPWWFVALRPVPPYGAS